MRKFIPKKYQEQGIELFVKKSFAGLFWPPGLGKTAVALFAFQILKKLKIVDRMMVISKPKVITNTWPREIKKWTPMFSHSIAKGGNKKFMAGLEAKPDILLMNMENTAKFVDIVYGARRKVQVGRRKVWKTFPPTHPELAPKKCMLIIDESSKFRNSNSSRFEALSRKVFGLKRKIVLNMFPRRYILTGSPAPKSLLNLWAQMYIIDLGEALGEFVTHFRIKYFHPAGFKGYSWEINDGAAKQIYKRLTKRILRIGEGVLKLPKKVFINRYVDLEDEDREVYNEMERESILELEGEKITAVNAGVKTQKLRQLANGFVYGPSDKKTRKKRKSYKINEDKAIEALNLVEETQGVPAIIGYIYDSDLVTLAEVFSKFKGEVKIVSRGTSDDEFNDIEEEWNAGEIDVLIAQIDIVSHGLNLQETEASVIYYTIPWDLEAYEQFYRRVWRQGQKFTVMIYHLLTRDSVDDKVVLPCIEKKDKRQQHFLDYLENFMARRKKFARSESLTRVGNKEGMAILADCIVAANKKVPVVKENVKDPGGVLMSAIRLRTKQWTTTQCEDFIKEVTKNPDYEGPTGIQTINKMVDEILCADIEKPITPDTYKMWPGFRPKGKKMTTKKAKGKGFGSKKKADPKETKISKKAAKKAAKKKPATKKKAPAKKKAVAKSAKDGKTYIDSKNGKTPKLALRAKIVKKVRAAKGRGMKGDAVIKWAEGEGITGTKTVAHLTGSVKKGFLKIKK